MKRTFCILSLLLLAASSVLVSCRSGYHYALFHEVPEEGWRSKKELFYSFSIEDTTQLYDIHIDIRYTERYPYNNLVLGIISETNTRRYQTETVEVRFREADTRISKGGYHFHLTSTPVYLKKSFATPGVHTISLQHLMADTLLVGLEEIGLRIVRSDTSGT